MPSAPNPRTVSLANGLVYVSTDMPGISRVRYGSAFRYRDARGRWLRNAAEISRIRSLAIPPAYSNVWICPLPNGHLQATGIDARGRKQYRYHAEWRLLNDETKYNRLEAFGRALPRIRARVARDLRAASNSPLGRSVVVAAVVRLLDTTFLRVGNQPYAVDNKSYGLTTLRNRHADVRGSSLSLSFKGKSGVRHEAKLADPRVARVVRRCQQLPGQELFQYQDEDGTLRTITSSDVNDYLKETAGEGFSAKDFRTWHGTVLALELTRLAFMGMRSSSANSYSAKEILNGVARQLGNTPAVCKKAYIHPAVLSLGTAIAKNSDTIGDLWVKIDGYAENKSHLHAAEGRLLAFLRQDRIGSKRKTSKVP